MKKTELIETMKRNNIRIVLNTVLIKDNINQLERYFELVNELGIDWFLARPVPTLNNKMPIINTDVRLLIEKLMNLKDKYGWINVDGIPFCAYDPEKVRLFSNGAKECGIFNKLVVDPTGKIKPCYSVDKNLGNALKANILDAWKNEFPVNIRQLRLLPKICKECKYVYECLGGCRFAAKLVNGSYASLDPLAMPEKYKEKLFD